MCRSSSKQRPLYNRIFFIYSKFTQYPYVRTWGSTNFEVSNPTRIHFQTQPLCTMPPTPALSGKRCVGSSRDSSVSLVAKSLWEWTLAIYTYIYIIYIMDFNFTHIDFFSTSPTSLLFMLWEVTHLIVLESLHLGGSIFILIWNASMQANRYVHVCAYVWDRYLHIFLKNRSWKVCTRHLRTKRQTAQARSEQVHVTDRTCSMVRM